MARKRKEPEVTDEVVDVLPPPNQVDKSKPYTDEQYMMIANMPSELKRGYMSGFTNTATWSEEDIKRHYKAAHFPEVRYHSSGGGGKGTATPPNVKY